MNAIVCKNPDELASRAAEEFASVAKESIEESGAFSVALSGGSTPLLVYKRLLDASLDWERVYFFFGDERNVPPDEEASNFRNANKALFRPLRIREDRIFRWRTELGDPKAVADDYFVQLVNGFSEIQGAIAGEPAPRSPGVIQPVFDLILLGMGSDGHTASLFPDTAALEEKEKFAVQNWVPKLADWRYTLSFPVLNMARNVVFLVAGGDKAEALEKVLEDQDSDLPAKRVQPANGKLSWFVDSAAAVKLSDANI